MGISPGAFMGMQIAGAATSAIGAYYTANNQKIGLTSQGDSADSQSKMALIAGQMEQNNSESVAQTAELNATTSSTLTKMQAGNTAYMADMNAFLAEKSAQSALLQGERQTQALYTKAANLKSTQRATMAANGLDLTSETPQNILTSTDAMKEQDANAINLNAVRAAWGYRMEATNFENQSIAAKANGDASSIMTLAGGKATAANARLRGNVALINSQIKSIGFSSQANQMRFGANSINPWASGGTSLIGSASSVATNYYLAKKSGMFDTQSASGVDT
ncbi:hypothetical protein UFOVP66_47 [uncultured Caudovirales phage]|uniref:Uncharacterized protein n=1 Tax=uncultured Caudovirales phage TaxID=2100421 RepID=A0A6J5KV17_9CAUD|nr:hypothetical protein UFOVP66_47 [uncultured Caudovirales phage]